MLFNAFTLATIASLTIGARANWMIWEGSCTTGLGGEYEEACDSSAIGTIGQDIYSATACSHNGVDVKNRVDTPNSYNSRCEDTLSYVPTGNGRADAIVKSTGIKLGYCESTGADDKACDTVRPS
ncbi:hypothetical protein DL765_007214 [Monosporascus sp. GIB2]|nr:hypothetical protein DL765_007214 [Monosporascus sp. GIB2]